MRGRKVSQIHRRIESMSKVQRFLSSKRRKAINTVLGYKTSLAYFQQFLTDEHEDVTLETIIELFRSRKYDVYDLLDQFVNYLQTMKISQSSVHQYLTGTKSYFLYNDIDIVSSKFKQRVTIPKSVQEEEQAIDQDDIRNILLKCNNRRLKAYLLVLASSGVRAKEACAIRLCDLDFQSNPTRLHVRGEYTKTKVSRDIYISNEATHYLKDWIEFKFKIDIDQHKHFTGSMGEQLVFKGHISSNNINLIYQKLWAPFQSVLKSAGLDGKKESSRRGRITFHSFRRLVKTTISNSQAGSDYSEWFLGHRKNSYYVNKPEVRAEIYATKCMQHLTFLDFAVLKATGRNIEARVEQVEKEKQITNQKHEEEIKVMREQMTLMGSQLQKLIKIIANSDQSTKNIMAKHLVNSQIFKPNMKRL
jgi:integrase